MSVNPKIYSKCLTADENRSFSYLVTNENAVLTCGVTTKGKIITLERLGAAYCLKLYCLTTNSQKWECIIQKDMKVLQYANINIFVINNEKHAFELIDRDESAKLYEKIRGCIKKLSSVSTTNPTNQATGSSRPKEKPVRPPPTYRTSINNNKQLQSNVLTVPSITVNALVDLSDKSNFNASTSSNNNITRTPVAESRSKPEPLICNTEESTTNALPNATIASGTNISSTLVEARRPVPVPLSRHTDETRKNVLPPNTTIASSTNINNLIIEGTRPIARIRYPEDTSRNALPNVISTSKLNISSPILIEQMPATDRAPHISINSAEDTNTPIPSPRRKPPRNLVSPITRSPILSNRVPIQDVGIPIVNSSRPPRTTASQNQVSCSTALTVLSRQNSSENSLEDRINYSGSFTIGTNHLINRMPNNTTSASIIQNNPNINSIAESNISTITSGCEPGSTANIIASVIPTRSPNASTHNGSNNASTAVVSSSNLASHNLTNCNDILSSSTSSVLASIMNGRTTNANNQSSSNTESRITNSAFVTYPNTNLAIAVSSTNLANLNINRGTANNSNTQGPLSNRPYPMNNANLGSSVASATPTTPIHIQDTRRRVKTANAANRHKTRSAFVQPTSMVTDILVQFKSRLFTKEEEKAAPKCMVIGNPTNVTHKIHLDSLDFRKMQMQDTQMKGLIKSKSMENLSSLSENGVKIYEIDEEGPTCVICLTDPPTHVIVPCGHKILCESCVQQNVLSKLRRKWCMTCNGVIREIIKVYD